MKRVAFLALLIISLSCTRDQKPSIHLLINATKASDFWVKVHAIEFLIDLGYCNEAETLINKELKPYEKEPQKRIGYWRSAYRLARNSETKLVWLNKILAAYSDSNGQDRIHAAESLAKINYSLKNYHSNDVVKQDLDFSDKLLSSFVLWSTCIGDKSTNEEAQPLIDSLTSKDPVIRRIMGYALTFFSTIDADQWNLLAKAAKSESSHSEAKPYLLSAAYILYYRNNLKDVTTINKIKESLDARFLNPTKNDRIEICRSLAVHASKDDLIRLEDYLNNKYPIINNNKIDSMANLDVQVAASFAINNHRKP